MLQEALLVRDQAVTVLRTHRSPIRDVHREEILRVLERAARDRSFIAELTDRGDKALRQYHLSRQEKAALLSGDIRWIEARVGKLDARLRTWLDCRLEQEKW